ncbi:uncharacterized protein EKO05_0000994 [Ascochyta rabiei]|uniref:Uncharacterized protein n=1 Tax=Didymella rabiei TaxID=5454 RepID=A0A163BB99_DIDRA|nr:uncharacterized protein EKO05_0000994 [Ascochyta rabiei]KZM21669.1 hypothetical protein ST47_g7177 [Ascochyta rabiei]UPX10328.1 hypothetical protein EKO05_0000994 [Ascochyta rabiei]
MIDYPPQDDWHGYNPVFVHITDALKTPEEYGSEHSHGPLIDTLSGDFTITKKDLVWRIESNGRHIDGNLIVKLVHTLQSKDKESFCVSDLLTLPIRLCPHQSTTFDLPERSRYIKGIELNGSLLIHAIKYAFPVAAQTSVNMNSLKQPSPSEQEQISRAQSGETVY